jgi:hypothetical protein
MVFKFVIQWRLMFSWAMLINAMKLLNTLPSKEDYLSQNMPYCNVNFFEKNFFWNFWAIDRTLPTLNKFYYLIFINENNRYSRYLYKI